MSIDHCSCYVSHNLYQFEFLKQTVNKLEDTCCWSQSISISTKQKQILSKKNTQQDILASHHRLCCSSMLQSTVVFVVWQIRNRAFVLHFYYSMHVKYDRLELSILTRYVTSMQKELETLSYLETKNRIWSVITRV